MLFNKDNAVTTLYSISRRVVKDSVRTSELFTSPLLDEEYSFVKSVFDSFYNIHKNFAIHQLTNLTNTEFLTNFEMFESELAVEFKSGRGVSVT